MLSSRPGAWCCLFFQGLLWLWQDTQDPRWQSCCCSTYTSMILTEGDFFYERKICFKTLLCCTPGIRPHQSPSACGTHQDQQTSAEQGQFGVGIQEEGSLWQRVISKLKNLEEGNWGCEVQTGSFCS